MIDTHCHIDLYPNPSEVALGAAKAGVTTIAVTNLPSAFDKAYPHVRPMKHLRLALGMHPLLAGEHAKERKRFEELADKTSYIGEVGLDFSRAGAATRKTQMETFRFILQVLQGKPKFISVHSRQAESTVLDLLEEARRDPVVLHWYSGTNASLERALAKGHYFSVNPAMSASRKGKQIIARIPPNRMLTETDGPFVKSGSRSACPEDVKIVEKRLSALWQIESRDVSRTIRSNFLSLIGPIRNDEG